MARTANQLTLDGSSTHMLLTEPDGIGSPVPLPLIPRAADCSNCGGSGKVWLESDGGSPWKGKQLVDCPICRGSGKA